MENCARCGVSGNEVRLFDAIYDGFMENICERCAIIENIPVIKKPDTDQLKNAEQVTVYKRMKEMSGIPSPDKKESFFVEDKLKQLDEHPELELPERDKLNLIQHFHWEIMKNRRRKGLSQKQLAENLGESETAIAMLEKAKYPENAEVLIKKLEQFLMIRLRKLTDEERRARERIHEKPILLDESGHELDKIPEPQIKEVEIEEIEIANNPEQKSGSDEVIEEFGKEDIENLEENSESAERDLRGMDMEKGELDITKANLDNITISDLKDLHRKKIEASRQEKEEEKRRIEERQKLIEAKKEELRLMREKESRELDRHLGGSELLGRRDRERRDENSVEGRKRDDFDDELI